MAAAAVLQVVSAAKRGGADDDARRARIHWTVRAHAPLPPEPALWPARSRQAGKELKDGCWRPSALAASLPNPFMNEVLPRMHLSTSFASMLAADRSAQQVLSQYGAGLGCWRAKPRRAPWLRAICTLPIGSLEEHRSLSARHPSLSRSRTPRSSGDVADGAPARHALIDAHDPTDVAFGRLAWRDGRASCRRAVSGRVECRAVLRALRARGCHPLCAGRACAAPPTCVRRPRGACACVARARAARSPGWPVSPLTCLHLACRSAVRGQEARGRWRLAACEARARDGAGDRRRARAHGRCRGGGRGQRRRSPLRRRRRRRSRPPSRRRSRSRGGCAGR